MSDTREEIAMDKWFQDYLGSCQTCEHYYKGFCNFHEEEIECIGECNEYSELNLARAISEQRKKMWEKLRERT